MNDPGQLLSDFRKYAVMIRQLIAGSHPYTGESESGTAIQIERGIVFPLAMLDPGAPGVSEVGRLIELSLSASDRLAAIAVIDRGGHHRPAYREVLIYCWLQAFSLVYETLPRSEFGRWEEGLRPWCDLLEADLGEIEWPAETWPASRGSDAAEAAWTALALHNAGKIFVRDAWTDLASDTFGRFARSQTAEGAFLQAGASDNPETHWYHELVLLHAAASYAVQAEDRPLSAAVARAAEFHHLQTQPDHATNDPWALFAFIWHPPARPLAEQVLHSCQAHPSGGLSLMLLTDALYCLELFTK